MKRFVLITVLIATATATAALAALVYVADSDVHAPSPENPETGPATTLRSDLSPVTTSRSRPRIEANVIEELRLLENTTHVDSDTLSRRKRSAYFSLLSRLRDEPAYAEVLLHTLRRISIEDPAAQVALAALTGAGHGPAQTVLQTLMRERLEDAAFLRVVVASSGFLDQPNPQTIEALTSLVDNQDAARRSRTQATLALGAVAGRRSGDPVGRDVLAALERGLSTAADERTVRDYLGALGNARAESSLEVLAGFADAEDPQLRAKAIDAMRGLTSPRALQQVAAALNSDPDPNVQATALQTLLGKSPTQEVLEALRTAIEVAVASDKRAAIVTGLANAFLAQEPERIGNYLRSLADSTDDERLRGLVSRLLTKG